MSDSSRSSPVAVAHEQDRLPVDSVGEQHGTGEDPRAHWGTIAAADLFTTEVWTWRGLVTFCTVFVIDLASRRVQILGATPYPDDAFMRQERLD